MANVRPLIDSYPLYIDGRWRESELDPDVQMGPLISQPQLDRVQGHVVAALDAGAILATGGRRPVGVDGVSTSSRRS